MPQMAPMSWIMLFMFFTTSLIIFNILNYYSFTPTIKTLGEQKEVTIKSKNWKW